MNQWIAQFALRLAKVLPDNVRYWLTRSGIAPCLRRYFNSLPSNATTITIGAGPLEGYSIVTDLSKSRAYVFGTYEQDTVHTLSQYCRLGMTAIDLGAHEGYLTLLMAKLVGETGCVYSFEPLPENFGRLSQSIAVNAHANIVPIQMALSDKGSIQAKFAIRPDSSFMGQLVDEQVNGVNTISVEVSTLDSQIVKLKIERVHLVKIDVEGHEIKVLKGMKDILENHRPTLIVEFHSEALMISGCEILNAHRYSWKRTGVGLWTLVASPK